jgi:hypothetical protein
MPLIPPALKALSLSSSLRIELIPIWDERTNRIFEDELGRALGLAESDIRGYISAGMMTVTRGRGNDRRVYWCGTKRPKGSKETPPRNQLRIPVPTKYCVAEMIGVYRVYKHVAHRCSAVEPTREPINPHCM